MPRDRYHHGDLADALLGEAIAVIDEGGAAALSLRDLGQRAGVSRSALYRHFPSKAALLSAVAEQGFTALQERLNDARAEGGALERLAAMGVGYVAFAVERPELYRLMFGSAAERGAGAGRHRAAQGAFEALRATVEQGQAEGAMRPGPTREMTYSAWAAVHGLAMLAIDRQIRPDLTWSVLARRVTRDLIDGLAVSSPTEAAR